MFKSTIKKSNIINLLYTQTNNKAILNKINLEINPKKQKTFLIEDSKKRLIPKLNEDKRLFYTKSEINFKNKNNKFNPNLKEQNSLKNQNDDLHSIKKQKFMQKLKDMIFSPGDINYNEKELKENGGAYNAYNLINKNICNLGNLLPNKTDNKKTLVLDLDETLIHSAFDPFNPKDDITLSMKIKDEEITIHVLKRPYLDQFLNIVTQKYEVVIFTASISDYANPLLNQLDPFKKIAHRLFREHCTKSDNGLFIKDLNRLGRNLKDVIIIDNNPVSFTFNKGNGLPILTWHSIQSDNELIKLIPLLTYLANVDDVRTIINKVVNGYYINYKEVNKIISNNSNSNNYSLNNNKDDDYFNNWFPTAIKRIEKKNSFNYSTEKNGININNIDLEKSKNKNNVNNQMNNIKRKESFDQLIKYKGLLGSKEQFNFDNYKKSRHMKLFSGFFDNNDNSDDIINDNNHFNKGYLTKKSSFLNINEVNNKNLNNDKSDKYNSLYNAHLDKKRNHSSKNLIKIIKNVNNEKENKFYFNNKKIKKEKNPTKYKDISFTRYNNDYSENSKLNKTDTNININKNNDYNTKIIMNNNTNIINNNIYVINDKQQIIDDENSKTIEYSNRKMFNEDINRSYKDGYKSANSFYIKKERAQSAQYKQKQVNHDNELSKLIDNLINYNKNNKNMNINSNQLIAISNNTNYINNQKQITNNKIKYLNLNKGQLEKDLFKLYYMRNNNEKTNSLFSEFNNKMNIYKNTNMNFYNSYKSSKSNIYVDTGNNLENRGKKNVKKSFLYEDNDRTYKNSIKYNNYKLVKHYTNIVQNKAIKYLSPIV